MGTCETCDRWAQTDNTGFGECDGLDVIPMTMHSRKDRLAILFHEWIKPKPLLDFAKGARAVDGTVRFLTPPGFGCNLWMPKGDA